MTVRPVTPLVESHGLVLSDKTTYDRWRDELAVDDPYNPDFEPVYSHGLVLPPEDVAAAYSAATPASPAHTAGRPCPVDTGSPVLSSHGGGSVSGASPDVH